MCVGGWGACSGGDGASARCVLDSLNEGIAAEWRRLRCDSLLSALRRGRGAAASLEASHRPPHPHTPPLTPTLSGARPLPLKPAVDLLHVFGATATPHDPGDSVSASGPLPPQTAAAATRALPLVVRQMLTQHATQEAIRRAEVVRAGGPTYGMIL